jgi:hypothetical protein
MNNHTGCRCISDEEVHEIFKEMEDEAKIQNLEQKLADMTKNRDWWKAQCKELYEDFKPLAEKFERLFPTQGIQL